MTTLDMLASESASAIHLSVAGVRTPVGGIVPAARAAAIWHSFTYIAGGAAAGAVAVLVLFMFSTTLADPVPEVPATSEVAPTTLLETPPPTAAAPDSSGPESNGPDSVVPPVVSGEGQASSPDTTVPPTTLPDTTPPELVVLSPGDGERFSTKSVTFKGSTEAGATVLASGKFAASVDSSGSWSVPLVLAPGANGVVFVATDAAGNSSTVRITVHLDVETTTTTTKTSEWVFTAVQKYGTCEQPLPYDIFYGTAKPGSTVSISSPHGGGTAVANADGKWEVQVNFPTAVYNEPFTVKVKDFTGAKKTFNFVSLYKG